MPFAIVWTPDTDAALHRMRAAGVTWDAIAGLLGVSRNSALMRGRAGMRGGAVARERAQAPSEDVAAAPAGVTPGLAVPQLAASMDVSDARLPLPAGDAITWAAITSGTILAGASYPAWALDAGEGAA